MKDHGGFDRRVEHPVRIGLVRAGRADGLIVLREENLPLHGAFLSPSGFTVVNASREPRAPNDGPLYTVDADSLAAGSGNPRAVNLVLLGFALSRLGGRGDGDLFFCSPEAVRESMRRRLAGNDGLLEASLRAFELGILHGKG